MRTADWILHNARVYTMDKRLPVAASVALSAGRILAVSERPDELLPLLSPAGRAIDLRGATVLPGFTDGHVHFLEYARKLRRLALDGLASLDDVLEVVARRVSEAGPDEWVLGGGWDRNLWADPRFPTRHHLDRIAPHVPVALDSKDLHSVWANSRALEIAGITRDTPDPEGGEIERDESGEPTGILKENACKLLEAVVPKPGTEETVRAVREAIAKAHAVGVTGIHDCEKAEALACFGILHQRGELKLRVLAHLNKDTAEDAMRAGVFTGLGDATLRIGGLKLFADGSLGSRTAYMLQPFEGTDNCGICTMTKDEMRDWVLRACDAGISATVHAIGDRANREVLDVLAEARQRENTLRPPLRHRIEHAQLLTEEDIPRFAALDIIASVQPTHATADYEMVDRYWGARGRWAYPFRSLLVHGTRLAFGSDCPVERLGPLLGIHAAVTRRRPDGSPGPDGWQPQERLTVEEAVRAFTMGNAYAAGLEGQLGSITPGKLADLAVLSEDIFTVDPMRIPAVKVLGTFFGGRLVYVNAAAEWVEGLG
ncbi:MAG: amidohydrolase [Chloroflexi bacterium]|nr:amidohydrolase [Chloroflexota bacterium]